MSADETVASAVVAEAMGWLGTPYRHQGRRKGVGCDCLGLILGVWQALYGKLPATPGSYAPDWAESGGEDRLTEAAHRFCVTVTRADPQAGDLILFRWRAGLPAKHCAIAVSPSRILHAYEGRAVLVSPLVPHWRRRIAGLFTFPPLSSG